MSLIMNDHHVVDSSVYLYPILCISSSVMHFAKALLISRVVAETVAQASVCKPGYVHKLDNCVPCEGGTFSVNDKCEPCPKNTYAGHGVAECTPCLDGMISVEGSGSSAHCVNAKICDEALDILKAKTAKDFVYPSGNAVAIACETINDGFAKLQSRQKLQS